MATINAVGVGLSGASGTGNFSGTTSPTFVTPTLGSASATSISFSSTSGIIGTATNNNAAAGSVGEFQDSTLSGAINYTSTTTATNIQSLSLTAGDWDVHGYLLFSNNGSTTTLVTSALSLTSVTQTAISSTAASNTTASVTISNFSAYPYGRVSLSGTTTVYLVSTATFSAGTPQAFGGITARRIR